MKCWKRLMAATAIAATVTIMAAVAGSVYDRAVQALGNTTGTATWTNTKPYAALALKRIWIEGSLGSTATVTVTRVTSDGTYTQAVGSVVCSGGKGSTATLTAAYLAPGDMLKFASSVATGATAIVEYEVQQH